eukprot:GHVN01028515.1.p1 GENE.GHVN01028515.1~~GHVN01028515.1.p1  ORF type:complete len:197 (+),score=51.67 GHVN01028515.1:633-1223(+)
MGDPINCEEKLIEEARGLITSVNHFPQPGVVFKDWSPLLRSPDLWGELIELCCRKCERWAPQAVMGLDARGFIIGAVMAHRLNLPLITARKGGKLPNAVGVDYELEYGKARMEVGSGAISEGKRVMVVDDVLATGGTAKAAGHLVSEMKGVVAGYLFVIEIEHLNGKNKLKESEVRRKGDVSSSVGEVEVFSLIKY